MVEFLIFLYASNIIVVHIRVRREIMRLNGSDS